MATLLLRLAGPMQSWGTQSRFTNRDTELEPSKSGVIGLVCTALGVPRDDTTRLKQLADLNMGVRVDKEGVMRRDYHTTQNVVKAGGGIKECEPSERFYLVDACFLVALQGNSVLLKEVDEALQKPAWQLFLGRKSFVPGLPVWLKDGLMQDIDDVEKALKAYPFLCAVSQWKTPPEKIRMEIETEYGEGERVKHDQPISFLHRRFGLRHVKTKWVETASLLLPHKDEMLCIYHA